MDLELYFDQLEAYAEGRMPEAERAAFEAELADSAELRQALQHYRLSRETVEQGIEDNLRGQLETWAAEEAGYIAPMEVRPKARIVAMRPQWIRLAAAACVVLMAGWFLLQWAGRGYTDHALYSANYELPRASDLRSGTAGENPLEAGYKTLENKDFQAAVNYFKTIEPENERYGEAQFYLGHAALQLKQYNLAIEAFETTIRQNEAKFREDAEWNLTLTYVAAHRTKDMAFKNLLAFLINTPGHAYHRQAFELEKKLGSFLRK